MTVVPLSVSSCSKALIWSYRLCQTDLGTNSWTRTTSTSS